MKIAKLTVGPFAENTWLVSEGTKAVLVDPGDEAERLLDMIEADHLELEAIWLTHAHLDHIGGIAGVRRRWKAPIHLHPMDLPLYRNGSRQAEAYGVDFEQPDDPDVELAGGSVVRLGALRFDVLHLPGHAPGHVAFFGEGVLLSGDLLFEGSIGRTDLPMSDSRQMAASLAKLAALPPATVVYPGHGPATTIGAEVRTNPFLNGTALPAR
ncbi:MAG: MBL fold metallo-hydrolase [Gemmatimonadota bacterium]